MTEIKIERAQPADIPTIAKLASILYREEDENLLMQEFTAFQTSQHDALFIAKHAREIIGFVHLALRFEYVEGADTSPVGYVEGIYIVPAFRQQKVARQLLEQGGAWAKQKGCTQLASDAELENTVSQAFHEQVGFEEVNRGVSYIKTLAK